LLKPFEGSRHWFPPFLNVSKAFRLWRKKKKPSIPTYKFGAHPSMRVDSTAHRWPENVGWQCIIRELSSAGAERRLDRRREAYRFVSASCRCAATNSLREQEWSWLLHSSSAESPATLSGRAKLCRDRSHGASDNAHNAAYQSLLHGPIRREPFHDVAPRDVEGNSIGRRKHEQRVSRRLAPRGTDAGYLQHDVGENGENDATMPVSKATMLRPIRRGCCVSVMMVCPR